MAVKQTLGCDRMNVVLRPDVAFVLSHSVHKNRPTAIQKNKQEKNRKEKKKERKKRAEIL